MGEVSVLMFCQLQILTKTADMVDKKVLLLFMYKQVRAEMQVLASAQTTQLLEV